MNEIGRCLLNCNSAFNAALLICNFNTVVLYVKRWACYDNFYLGCQGSS